jgi:hypothetical protein
MPSGGLAFLHLKGYGFIAGTSSRGIKLGEEDGRYGLMFWRDRTLATSEARGHS